MRPAKSREYRIESIGLGYSADNLDLNQGVHLKKVKMAAAMCNLSSSEFHV